MSWTASLLLLSLTACTHAPSSPFTFRMVYYSPATDSAWAAQHHVRQVTPGFDGVDPDWGLWVHTMHRFVPASLIDAHPEYFAERNGIRIPDQVCFSNQEVLRITVDSLRAMMKRFRVKPGMTVPTYWSVSQLDNFNYCQCAQCSRTDSLEGSHSGSILRFVNQVADSFPDKVISTLAYQYSRTAPKLTKPRPNVNIMLCSIEEDRSKPIASREGPGSFTADLYAWSKLTHNIIVWDYVINFWHLLAPFPNWKVLQPNIQLFRDAGVPMVFEQGLSNSGGEMPEFRATLLADLLWNPDLNVDSLRTAFMNTFYGPAAGPDIDEYTRLMEHELEKSGLPLTLYEHPQAHKNGYLSPANLARYKTLLTSAEAAAMDEAPLFQQRVKAAQLPLMYAELEIARALPGTPNGLFEKGANGQWKAKPYYTALLDTFTVRAKRHGNILLHETRLTPDEYQAQFSAYLRNGVVSDLAVGKKITFTTPPASKYTGGSPDALIDGFRATTNYQFAWQGWSGQDLAAVIDLGTAQRVSSVGMGFLEDQASWIFLPSTMQAETSTDGKRWTTLGKQDIPLKQQEGPPNIHEVTLQGHARSARYVRVAAKNLGALPASHGSKGACWLFCDEVMVR